MELVVLSAVLAMLVAGGVLAATVMIVVTLRRDATAASGRVRAAQLAVPFTARGWDAAALIYALRSEGPAAGAGLILRDADDREIGRLTVHRASRAPWLTLETPGAAFEADLTEAPRQTVVLHPAGAATDRVCTARRTIWGSTRFRFGAGGEVVCRPVNRRSFARRYTYRREDRMIGAGRGIGGFINRGAVVVLPDAVPLPVRMLALALQVQRG
jgi:hypothetical protein